MDDESGHEADDDMGYDLSDVAFTEWLGLKNFNYKTMDHYTKKALWITDKRMMKTGQGRTQRSMRSRGLTLEFGPNPHQSNILASLSTIRLDVQNGQHVDYKWYEALEDSELNDEALRNKAIIDGFINGDDELRYEQEIRWNIYTNYDDAYEINHRDNEREELCEVHELLVCNIRRYMMIKYPFNNNEEYFDVKED
ncbi:hypothetical protein Tco_0931172 [Tanacetum coccineum]